LEIQKSNKQKVFNYIFSIVKSFCFVGLFSALLIGAFMAIRSNSFYGFIDGIQFGILLAIVMVPLIYFLDIFQRIKNYRKYKKFDFNVNQKRRLLIKDKYISIFNYLINALNSQKAFSIYKKDKEKGIIDAGVGRS
jgi:hypothetical protein